MSESPYLSLVAVSRNDEHGGNTLERTQIFVDSFLDQCGRHKLRSELIIVEWNPPPDRPPLAEVVSWVRGNEWVDCRVITVPYERHMLLNYARKLPLFQMIGKNVGIRRATGEFILATNIDVLLSEELFVFLARKELRADRMYRCDRFDVDERIRNGSLDEKLDFAWKNMVRKNIRSTPSEMAALQRANAPISKVLEFAETSELFDRENLEGVDMLVARARVPYECLHLCACGDFTLLHREGWARIGGYAELDVFSLHLDSLGVQCAHAAGLRETWLAPPAVCFHVEHALGSGYTEGNSGSMYERLARQGIGWLEYDEIRLYFEEMSTNGEALQFNHDFWGLRDIPLDETACSRSGLTLTTIGKDQLAPWDTPVSAIREEFEIMAFLRRVIDCNKVSASKDHATLTHGVHAYRKAFEDAQTHRNQLTQKLAEQREMVSKLKEELKRSREQHRVESDALKAALQGADQMQRLFAEKLRATRERLAKYRNVFGGLERLGFFR